MPFRVKWGSRSKYKAVPTVVDGIRFASIAESEMYKLLKADKETRHIDCHVPVTLPGGIRFSVDFIRWYWHGPNDSLGLKAEAVEVKGFSTQDFKTKRRLFDQFHPLSPLQVFRKNGKNWEAI